MTDASIRGHVALASGWDADAGPPAATLLSRAERGTASFSARILAHVLGPIASRSGLPLSSVPWVLGVGEGSSEAEALDPVLRRRLAPARGLSRVHAGIATVPMALFEALAHLASNDAVLVAFAQDATAPHHEALAAALLLTREPKDGSSLVVLPPTLRRTSSHLERKSRHRHPFAAALGLARAIGVGQPTIETVPSCEPDLPECWRIELCAAF